MGETGGGERIYVGETALLSFIRSFVYSFVRPSSTLLTLALVFSFCE